MYNKHIVDKDLLLEQEINRITSDRKIFDEYVYTPLEEAVHELEIRKQSSKLNDYVSSHLNVGVPSVLKKKNRAIVFVQIATPNYELRRFMQMIDSVNNLSPLFFEYYDDKFTDNNEWKYNLGKMSFFFGKGKKGGDKVKRLTIINFATSNGKKLRDINTIWGESIIKFHHNLFNEVYSNDICEDLFYDASDWFKASGDTAKEYYQDFLRLLLKDCILFENYMINENEIEFTKEYFLPAFIKIKNESGKKPLIVNIQPTDIEGDDFWKYHPSETYAIAENKLIML